MFEIDSLLHSEKKRASFSPAFTLVELLIVIVIIAILAAITIVAFNGIQDRARASAVSAALNQASKKLELYSVDNGGYPATLSDAGVTDSNNVSYQYTASTAPSSTYCTTATQGSTSYYISNTTKTPTKGGCPGHGQGGVAAVTNLAVAPRATAFGAGGGPTWLSDRFGGSNGTYALLTSQASPGGTDITTAARYTVALAGSGRGFHLSGNPETTTPGTSPITRFPVAAGSTYTISCWLRTSQPGLSFMLRVRPAADANTWVNGGTSSSSVAATAGSWTRVTQIYAVPASTTGLAIYAIVAYSGVLNAGETMDGTGLMVTSGSSTYSYADGSSPNWVWNGATNNSTSTGPAL